MRKITCHCEQVFNVDLPESVNLDLEPGIINDISNGSFLSCVCPTCGAVLHTDLKTRIEWPSHGLTLTLIPEIERLSYLSGNYAEKIDNSVVIGYAELADRVAVVAADLDPLAVEYLKYHLAVKALESNESSKIAVYFEKRTEGGDIALHIHGIKDNEVAVFTVPSHVYEEILRDTQKKPKDETCAALTNGQYVSYQNILIENNPHA